jgi:hypothetical protein
LIPYTRTCAIGPSPVKKRRKHHDYAGFFGHVLLFLGIRRTERRINRRDDLTFQNEGSNADGRLPPAGAAIIARW